MDKSIFLQKQVRDNSEDLRSYLKELATWEEDMKRKESELNNYNDLPEVPIPRTKIKKTEPKKEVQKENSQKIKSYDYAAWDKFDVEAECEKIDAEKTESDNEEPSEEYKNRLRDEAVQEKEKGNQFVKNKKWDEAIACYTHSIACYSKDPIFYANRALCFLKKNDLHSVEADCTSALQLDSTYVKALQRRAVAREGLKQYQESLDDLKRVLELEPHNKESRNELDRLERRLGIAKQISADTEPKKPEIKTKVDKTPVNQPIIETIPIKESPPIPDKQPVKKTLPKQIPWPERSGAEIIIPVTKLPHQRSKKPLRRIEILESDNNDVIICKKNIPQQTCELNSLNIDYDENNTLAKILAQSSQLDVDEILKDIENNVNNEINNKTIETEKQRSNLTISSQSNIQPIEPKLIGDSDVSFNFPIPKSSVQFYSNWKIMKKHQEQKFLYLSKINPAELPKIFQESLESDVFSDIIIILGENFIENNLPTFTYLQCLSNVKRFSALTMFMSNKEKICLKKIFAHCEMKQESTKEEIDKLRKKYEI